jgi:colanic acid/amylovoran biosynthesis glycosyltransferase
MRIAVFVEAFPVVSETFVLAHITGLLDLGQEVEIVAANRPEPGEPEHPEVGRYRLLDRTTYVDAPPESGYWELPVWPLTARTWPPGAKRGIPNALRALRAAPPLLRALRAAPHLALRVLRPSEYGYQAESLSALHRLSHLCQLDRSFDVLHAHFGPVANGFRFARELFRAPLVASFHGYDFSVWPRRHGPRVYDRLFAEVDAVTANSEFTRSRLLALGCPPERLHKLPAPFRADDFPFRERTLTPGEPLRLLSSGRLVEKKGFEYSLRAVARLRERIPAIRYDIVGDGPLRHDLTALVRELGIERVARLHGALSRDALRCQLDRAHVFILPSVTARDGDMEGQGVVLQEAQASGLPVVATDHNGFSEGIAPGRSGFLVPERDVEALTDALTRLAERPDIWPAMGRAGRKHVEESYDAQRICRRLVELYERLLGEPGDRDA